MNAHLTRTSVSQQFSWNIEHSEICATCEAHSQYGSLLTSATTLVLSFIWWFGQIASNFASRLLWKQAVINEDASGDVKALRAQIQQMKVPIHLFICFPSVVKSLPWSFSIKFYLLEHALEILVTDLCSCGTTGGVGSPAPSKHF